MTFALWRLQIVSGLKRSARGKLAFGAGLGQEPGNTALRQVVLRMAAACRDAASLYRRSGRSLGAWAARRSVSPDSLAGISLLLAICAGAWFSAGNTAGSAGGLIAGAGWLAALGAARSLVAYTTAREATATKPRPVSPAGGPAGSRFSWISAVCSAAAECAVYGGIAAGGARGMWPLAVMVIASVAIADMLAACRAAATAGRGHAAGGEQVRRRAARFSGGLRSPPVGARALIAAAGLVIAGSQAALFAVLAVEVISTAAVIATLGRVAPPAPDSASEAAAHAPTRRSGAALLALRDDGAAARWAGRLVQGMLIPLPPALAGLIATALLAALGLHNLPGFVAITPPVVMMLAAPGSSHPHDDRFDWLVPVLLATVQYVYFGSLGFALAVPRPVIFAACAMTYVWYAGVIRSAGQVGQAAGPRLPSGPGRAVGWESRLFIVGLAATLGLATFGYVVLAAYLGAFICRTAILGSLVTTEEDRR